MNIIYLPAVGWSVRPGATCAHWLFRQRGQQVSACGALERLDQYAPQRLRPRQVDKPQCANCEAAMLRIAGRRA
jgi:hypothetical protein